MGNAPVHRPGELNQLMTQAWHILKCAPQFSDEMNPIKFMAGIWKWKANTMLKGKPLADHTFTKAIEDSSKQIYHMIEKVYPKVFNGDTI